MKIELETIFDGITHSEHKITIPLEAVEADELRNALKILNKYEKLASKTYTKKTTYHFSENEWHNFGYCVKNDKVIITIKEGMIR